MSKQFSLQSNDEYPDKKMTKTICRIMYYCGLGDCWYEPMQKSRVHKYVYIAWCLISNSCLVTGVLMEVLAFTADLTVAEKNDNMQLSIAHSTMLLKFVTMFSKRNQIKVVLKKLLEGTRIPLSSNMDEVVVRRTKNLNLFVGMTMWLCMLSGTVDAVRLHYTKGIPIRTLVTIWPRPEDEGLGAVLATILIQVYWWYIVTLMVVSDSICINALILLRYKFKTLQQYFDGVRRDVLRKKDGEGRKDLVEDYEKAIVTGIKLHSETMWCAHHIQRALGNVYSIQVCQSGLVLVMCLIKLVRQERSLTMFLANGAFIMCVIALTGTYMMLAGDITHEASLVSNTMFYSGWDARQKSRRRRCAHVRALLVIGIQRSQEPVIMTAFGIFDLSYGNFLTFLRWSYSFFAVTY